jgi:hypothetical protein
MYESKMHNIKPTKAVIKYELNLINKEIRPFGIEILM